MENRRIGVLVSGRGSNLQAIIDAIRDQRLDATIAVVISNVVGAPALDRARQAGIPTLTMPHAQWANRAAYDTALAAALRDHDVAVVCLAGFMRLLTQGFLDAFPDRVLNIHPSLLPAFPGLDAQRQALDYGVKVTGATVHLVNADLDAGAIVQQVAVPVLDDDSEATLAARILAAEHQLYPAAISAILDGGWRVAGRRVVPASPSAAAG